MQSKLFFKVFGTYVLVVLVAFLIVGVQAVHQINVRVTERIENTLGSQAEIIASTSSKEELKSHLISLGRATGARFTLINADGTVIADSDAPVAGMENHLNRTEIQEARVKGKGSAVRYSRTLGYDQMYVAVPLRERDIITGYIRLAQPLTDIRHTMTIFSMIILRSLLLVGVISFIIALTFTSRLTSPIHEMVRYTKGIREGIPGGGLIIPSDDEMGTLARNINYMVSELTDTIGDARTERAKLEAAFAGMNDGVLVLNADGRIEALNVKLKSFFGKRYRDIIGKTPLEAFRNVPLQDAIDRFMRTGETVFTEITLGVEELIILDVNITAINGEHTPDTKTMIVLHDVTHLKKLEKMRVDFVASVTHEIKTPLTAILGFIETLRDGALEDRETAEKFLQIMYTHANRLNRLVDDLLTISDIELGNASFVFAKESLHDVIETVLPLVSRLADEKNIRIITDIPASLPSIQADRDRFSQILINVIDNAIKFTPPEGTVTIGAQGDDHGNVVITVTDTGIGIPRDEIPRLGERFYRVDKTRSRDLGGTGLGLSIVKHLMRAHGGEFTIESTPGRGTTVSLCFPARLDDGTSA